MKNFQLPNFKQQVKIEENLFDYKITFSSLLPHELLFNDRKKEKDLIVRYDSSIYRAKSKILDYTKNNKFNYFLTITVDSKKYDLANYEGIRKFICKYFNYIKNYKDKSFKYILVAEFGGKNGRLHFHGLVYLENKKLLKHVRNGLYRNEKLFTELGANQFKPIEEYNIYCAVYCSKYIAKDNSACDLFSRYYFCSKGLKTSRNITYLFDEKNLEELFLYFCSVGLLKNGSYADTMVVSREFILEYFKNKIEFEKMLV